MSPTSEKTKTSGKTKILSSAETVFAEKGFQGATMDEIAKKAGINKALLYYHFKNKDEILKVLIGSYMTMVIEKIPSFTGEGNGTPDEIIREVVNKIFQFFEDKKNVMKIIIIEVVRLGSVDTSIFEIFTLLSDFIYNLLKKKNAVTVENHLFTLNQFFFTSIPFILFFALNDKWSEFYGKDPKEVETDFKELFIHNLISTFQLEKK